MIPEAHNLPFAGAFWFIRNLMVFVLMSPIFWFVGRRWWLTLICFLICLIDSDNFYGSIWFMLGASAGCHHVQRPFIGICPGVISLLLYIGLTLIVWFVHHSFLLIVLAYAFMAVVIMWMSQDLAKHMGNRTLRTCVHATFFIYAFHQCFCFRLHRLWINLIGIDTFWATMATYISTFISILLICLAGYVVLRRYTPGLLSVMTGGRR